MGKSMVIHYPWRFIDVYSWEKDRMTGVFGFPAK
jgi:hypothetical protein